MNKPKIIIAAPLPPPYSGQEMITYYLMKSGLSERFEVVHVDISNKRSNEWRGKFDIGNITAVLRSVFRLLKAIIKEKPMLASVPMARNTWGFMKFSMYVLTCSLFRVKIVSRLGGDNFNFFWQASPRLMKKYIKFILNKITIVIVRARRLKRQFYSLVPKERLRAVYIGMDPSEFERSKIRNPDRINVLFVGHISKAKGALDILKAIPLVTKEVPRIKFYFAGNILKKEYNIIHIDNPPDIEAEVKRITRESNIGKYVDFLGIVKGDEKLDTFFNSHIFILPSYSEGFPFTILEAAAAGLPIIATRVGALPEVFKDKENILFVDSGDIKTIAASIIRLAKNKELRNRMGISARKLVAEKFNLDVLAGAMEKVFNEALKKVS